MNFYLLCELFVCSSSLWRGSFFSLSSKSVLLRPFLMFNCLVGVFTESKHQSIGARLDRFISSQSNCKFLRTPVELRKSWKEWNETEKFLALMISLLHSKSYVFLYRLMSELWCLYHHWSLWLSTLSRWLPALSYYKLQAQRRERRCATSVIGW